ncbi:MAG: hypothetical protein HC898_03590 [Phycisphaerales bacterium]|nr:hypothetical protein [Phycisphaerales bacterium]
MSLPGRSSERNQDCLVWANRGGGKTMLGAAATVLDLIFKPGIQVRILGGSLGQSSKMFTYLCEMFKHPWLRPGVEGEPTQRRLMLKNQSVVEVLAQSHTSVRGCGCISCAVMKWRSLTRRCGRRPSW